MDEVKIIELKESILEDNAKDAEVLRKELKQKKICQPSVKKHSPVIMTKWMFPLIFPCIL